MPAHACSWSCGLLKAYYLEAELALGLFEANLRVNQVLILSSWLGLRFQERSVRIRCEANGHFAPDAVIRAVAKFYYWSRCVFAKPRADYQPSDETQSRYRREFRDQGA
jgi:hypothetical protein